MIKTIFKNLLLKDIRAYLSVAIIFYTIMTCMGLSESNIIMPDKSQATPQPFDAIGTIPGCTATLIKDNLVLTAAHCLCKSDIDNKCKLCGLYKDKTNFTLHNVWPTESPAASKGGSTTRQNISINGTVYIDPNSVEDLAVIKLEKNASGVANVTPLDLEKPENNPHEGEKLTLIGFGETGQNCTTPSQMDVRRMANLTIEGNVHGETIQFKDPTVYACYGDSGGPALNNKSHVVGICGCGVGCDTNGNHISDYTSTAYEPNYNWILSNF